MPTVLNGSVDGGNGGEGEGGRRRMYFANSGALRFDILKGPFGRDEQFIACVLTSSLVAFHLPPHLSRL